MKKIASTLIFALICGFSYGQGNGHHGNANDEHWDIFGNSIDAQDVFGTINNFPINFITNNTQKMMLGTNGVLQINNLSGSGNRLLQTDANGNITPFAMGNSGQILFGDGTWGDFPSAAKSFTANGNILFTSPSTSLGIGTNNPQYPLDVLGDARISNNLFVGGGVVITNKVDASTEVKTGDMKVGNNLTVSGDASFDGVLNANKGIVFGNNKGISYTPPSGNSPEIFRMFTLLTPQPATLPLAPNPCNNPNLATSITQIPSMVQIYDALPGTNFYTGGNILSMQSWNNGSSIDVAGSGGLLVNYFCGKDIFLNTGTGTGGTGGTAGGFVYTGPNVQIGPGPQDANIDLHVFGQLDKTPLVVEGKFSAPSTNNYITRYWTSHSQSKVINVNNAEMGYAQTFALFGDGKTKIGKGPNDPYKMLTVNGDVSLANYNTSGGGNLTDGYSGLEILGMGQIPSRRGISVDADPDGDFNFFVNSNQASSQFHFKNGINNKSLVSIGSDGVTVMGTKSGNASGFKTEIYGENDQGTLFLKSNDPTRGYGVNLIVDVSTNSARAIIVSNNGAENVWIKGDGTIFSRGLVCTMGGFFDKVFEKDYQRMSYLEKEKYLSTNKHLPEIKSEKEIVKNGLDIPSSIAGAVKNIEENTLDIIDLYKMVQVLKNENEILRNEIKKLKK